MEQLQPTLLNWASILDPGTRAQAEATASLPFIHPHVALMPDAHLGKGAPVGSVIPTLGAIIPAAVGVDIGCGMIAVKLTEAAADAQFDPAAYLRHWPLQPGTLGSGNHFIEITRDETGQIWLFLHSGSRGVGNKIAQHHIEVARRLCAQWLIPLPDKDLAYLAEGTDEFWADVRQMRWAQTYALLNREEMMDRLIACVAGWIGVEVERQGEINCHHNYTEQEKHYGKTVWLSRKGAISARPGEPGLIPGSMGTASYVVAGLGNPRALMSAPHGAGRVHSRSSARRTFTID